jgi:hypothetical protein
VTSKPDDVVHSVTVNGDATGGVDFVLVHGFANGGGCFFKNIAALGDMKLGRTHLVDWRGAGMSGRPRGEFPPTNEDEAIEYFVDGLEAWRRARLGADGAFVLLGHRCVLYKSFSPIVRFQHLIASPFNLPVNELFLIGTTAWAGSSPRTTRTGTRTASGVSS